MPGGQSIEDMHRLERLQQKLIKQFMVDSDTDLFATRLTHQLPRYVSWYPDPKAIAEDAFFLNWATLRGYTFPPFNLIPRTLIKVLKDKTIIVLVAPSVARADLVAFTTLTGNSSASSPTFNTTNTEEPRRSNSDASNVPKSTSSCLACFERSRSTVGLPEHATRLLSASVCKSTNKTYDSSWRKWNGCCERRQIDPISAGLNNVLTFLSEQFESNLQYRTVNVLRSAILSTHQWVDGNPIGQHPLVIRLLKGISNERPPRPRYTTTWDVSKVTSIYHH